MDTSATEKQVAYFRFGQDTRRDKPAKHISYSVARTLRIQKKVAFCNHGRDVIEVVERAAIARNSGTCLPFSVREVWQKRRSAGYEVMQMVKQRSKCDCADCQPATTA